ncbi:DUF4435 domain-containing protein [Desulfobacula sp.]|uniref:DUF4435 domain-containing protein n=1 Tax=Desulfobacula sp. TaxID=2593537 RepID=UPI0025C6725B|nr:DUF4435 domain-containing protein [Desulfobacula sp.]MBC2703482.1 DUF4435 domain-containing protein [Desulfobacula sp.]
MHRFPQLTPEENLISVLMDKNNQYLVVEGASDMSIFSELMDLIFYNIEFDKKVITVFGGGKPKILDWIETESPTNVSVILDMDFDDFNNDLNNPIIFPLKRYSIENYFFNESVVIPLLANLLKLNINDIEALFSLDELKTHWLENLTELMPVLYYYQKIYAGNRNKWSSVFINQNHGYWQLSKSKIEAFQTQLLTEMGVDFQTCKEVFENSWCSQWEASINFPGKILFESFHRYLKNLCNEQKKKAYSPVTSKNSLKAQLIPRLFRNDELKEILHQSIQCCLPI